MRTTFAPSHAPLPASMGAVRAVLRCVDDLPSGASGVLEFGDGLILVENRKVCWAASSRLPQRLTDLLRHQSDPPIEQSSIEQVVRRCRGHAIPIGEGLVGSGLITEEQLGMSLRQHITESICLLAESADSVRWAERVQTRYDARFTFSTVQVLCSIGALRIPETSRQARAHLVGALVPDARGVSFVRDPGSASPLLLAEVRCDVFSTDEVASLCDWSMGVFDVSASITRDVAMVIATWQEGAVVTAWQSADATHVAVCEGPSFAVLATKLSDSRLRAAAPVSTL